MPERCDNDFSCFIYIIVTSLVFQSFGNTEAKLQQALVIARGLGMSIQGVRTCGDYMFSGHTVVITVLNHFITECESHLNLVNLSVCKNISLLTYRI